MDKNFKAYNYFSENSKKFIINYNKNEDFIERCNVWKNFIDKYSFDGSKAIDIGCGNGIFSFYLAEKQFDVTGIDAADNMIALCEERKKEFNIKKINFFKKEIPFSEKNFKKFDMIICSSVLEYIEKMDETIKLFLKLLNKEGRLIISFPNVKSIYRKIEKIKYQITGRPDYYQFVKNFMSFDKFNKIMYNNSFKLIEYKYYAGNKTISKLLKIFRFNAIYTDNMFIAVYKTNNAK